MKKVSTILFCLAILATGLIAQERTGNITGVVVDQAGTPLPGGPVTLTGNPITLALQVLLSTGTGTNWPGTGTNYDVFPVNAYEAESRRLARFFRLGHTPGKMDVAPVKPSLEHPFTIDLRTPL